MRSKIIKAVVRYIAAQLLCLFVNIMLAALKDGVFRAICLVCTAAVLVCILADLGIKEAAADLKSERISGKPIPMTGMLCAAAAVTLFPAVNRIVLFVSALGGGFEFYGIFKLLEPSFLQLCNFIEPSALSADLSAVELTALLPTAAVPGAALLLSYIITRKKYIKSTGF